MRRAYKTYLIILFLLFSQLPHLIPTKAEHIPTQIDTLPYQTTLTIPIKTNFPNAHYQPIDIRITFDPPAYTQNETNHAIRVGYEHNNILYELESQIYDLHHTDETHIDACSIVFLIPQDADGNETYVLLWDTKPTEPPAYTKYLTLEDTHYFYEPISGQKIDFDYYKIMQNGYVIYGIIQTGELLGEGVSHTVVKMKLNSTEFETINTDQFGNYGMTYAIDGPLQYTGSARAKEAQKTILANGNLMIRVRITTTSPEGAIKTDGIYTYYYCPTTNKRIDANINHEFLKTIELGADKQRDAYLGMSTFKARSATIENMNVGTILPAIHAYTEAGVIAEYSLPPDPDSEVQEWLLGTTDDVDLGTNGWVCLDDPTTGKAHGLILGQVSGLTNDNTDGYQIKASVKQVVKLPGLEADTGSLYLTRNSYEDGTHSPTIPAGLNITFNSEFFTTETGGYETVADEATYYQKLIQIKPISRGNVTIKPPEKIDRYTLTISAHLEPTIPLGAALSAVVGKRFSYLYAELYHSDNIISSGALSRLPLSEGLALDFKNTTLLEKIKLIIGLFDWRNAGAFKRIRFPDIEAGTYLVKIYKENAFRKNQGQYIGFSIVTINKDTTTRIIARPQGTIQLTVNDMQNTGIPNACCNLLYNNVTIAQTLTDEQGKATIFAPCYNRYPYTLQILYQGFIIKQKTIQLKARNQIISITQTAQTPLHMLNILVKDTWDLPIAIDVNPRITSKDMTQPTTLTATKQTMGKYQFINLIPAEYNLSLSFKSFKQEHTIDLKKDNELTIQFPAEYHITLNLFNAYGIPLSEGQLIITREKKQKQTEIIKDNITIVLPPADYQISITNNDGIILAHQPLDVRADKTLSILTNSESSLHMIISSLGILLLVISIIIGFWRKNLQRFLPLILIALLLIGIVQPWWNLTGKENNVTTTTNTLLYPPKLVTLTSMDTIYGGEIAAVPEELTMVLNLLSLLVLISIALLTIYLILGTHHRRLRILLSILTIISLIFITGLFYIAMTQITDIGVGSIMGQGPLNITIPGVSQSETITCTWGFSTGYYLIILTLLFFIIFSIKDKLSQLITKIRQK